MFRYMGKILHTDDNTYVRKVYNMLKDYMEVHLHEFLIGHLNFVKF